MKINKEEWKTKNDVFDKFTIRNLFNLSSKGYFDEVLSPISIGKEANVFYAIKNEEKRIVKIYRLETCDFNKMFTYIRTDPRFGYNLKRNKRQIIFKWTEREYRNLIKARDLGINVPTVYGYYHNILIEEFIGNKKPAKLLKDKIPINKIKFFEEIISNYEKLIKGGLVHGDLSEFNILNFNEKPVFIDFSQSTIKLDPNFKEYLKRDITNLKRFAKKIGILKDIEKKINKLLQKNR